MSPHARDESYTSYEEYVRRYEDPPSREPKTWAQSNVEPLHRYCELCGSVLDLGWPVKHPQLEGDPDKLWVQCRNCGVWSEYEG